MATFSYTLPSGAKFDLTAPTGTTQAQADFLFYSQVASGSLVGYTVGQTLSSVETRLTKFGLSRLDRGTAGVDSVSILAIIFGADVIAPTPPLINIPLTNPITSADFAQAGTPLGVTPIGPLTSAQTQALQAQIANLVDLPADNVTDGIGTYGLGPSALEQAGYLKPGTSNYPDPNCVIGTPEVWTGKNGVYSLTNVVNNTALQNQIQNEVMQNGYNALTASGTIQTAPTQPISLSQGQVYTSSGLSTLTPVALISGAAAVTGSLNTIVASTFANAGNISNLLSNPVTSIETLASGAVNSVTQGINSLTSGGITAANNLVNEALSSVTNLPATAVSAVSNTVNSALSTASGLVSGVNNAVAGSVGALITNASQFGSTVTSAWAQGSSALSSVLGAGAVSSVTSALGSATSALSGASGAITSALGTASGALSGAIGSLTSVASGALSTVTGQAQSLLSSLGGSLDIFGKMSSFSIDFSLFSSDSLVSATKVAAGYSNTVNRQTVDAAVTRILGNPKIPAPQFEYPSLNSLNLVADIQYAQNILSSLTSAGQQIASTAQNLTGQATQIASTVSNQINNFRA